MPMPFHCIECDKPVNVPMNGLCDNCNLNKDEEE